MAFRVAAVIWSAIALAVNAIVHFSLAPQFDLVQAELEGGAVITVGHLFRAGALVNAVLAVIVLIRPRRWSAALVAIASIVGLVLTVSTTVVAVELPFGLPTLPVGTWLQLRVIAAAAQVLALVGAVTIASSRRR
jgi:hypothetical protein